MSSLTELLLQPAKRPLVVEGCAQLIDDEVAAKGGFSGLAVKGAFMVVKKIKPGILREVVDRLLDESVSKLEPFYKTYVQAGGGNLQLFMQQHSETIASSLLEVADRRAAESTNRVLKGAYDKLRPAGAKHVEAAIPGLARLLGRHL
jgi:hypothetical protein